jgi:hypothetical protein
MKSDQDLWDIMVRLASVSDTDPEVRKKRGALIGTMTLAEICRAESLCAVPSEDAPRQLDIVFFHHFFRRLARKLMMRTLTDMGLQDLITEWEAGRNGEG